MRNVIEEQLHRGVCSCLIDSSRQTQLLSYTERLSKHTAATNGQADCC